MVNGKHPKKIKKKKKKLTPAEELEAKKTRDEILTTLKKEQESKKIIKRTHYKKGLLKKLKPLANTGIRTIEIRVRGIPISTYEGFVLYCVERGMKPHVMVRKYIDRCVNTIVQKYVDEIEQIETMEDKIKEAMKGENFDYDE